MEFTREEIIKIGEKEIVNSRKLWRSFAILSLIAFLIGLPILIAFLILNILTDKTSITTFVIFEIHTLGFAIFAFLYSYQKQYDRFESGRRRLESKYKGKIVPKVEYTTNPEPLFKEKTLYDCFVIQKAELNNNNNINKIKLVSKKEYTTHREPIKPIEENNNHNFDDFFTDEEFDDLMDD